MFHGAEWSLQPHVPKVTFPLPQLGRGSGSFAAAAAAAAIVVVISGAGASGAAGAADNSEGDVGSDEACGAVLFDDNTNGLEEMTDEAV